MSKRKDKGQKKNQKNSHKENHKNSIINQRIANQEPIYQFIKMIENYALESSNKVAIVTFYDRMGWLETYDVEYGENECIWGYNQAYKPLILAKLFNPDRYPICVVVRTFNQEKFMVRLEDNQEVEIPGKDIRMYIIHNHNDISQLSPEECFICYNTDSKTGEALNLDPTIRYR